VYLTWPRHTSPRGLSSDPDTSQSTLDTTAIEWRPVRGATEYEVHITHVVRSANSISSNGVLRRRLTGTSLPLSSLPQRQKPDNAKPDEYEVEVYAFDRAGTLLTQSEAGYGRAFQLTGASRLGKEEFLSSGGPHPIVISEEYETNQQRLYHADELLAGNQLEAAREVLERVTKDAPAGRALVLRGKLAALQGDCATATKLFDRAELEGGCAPLEERQLCSAPEAPRH
jgi:hypothetical protein